MARILVVEDDNEVANFFIADLKRGGHEAEWAATAYGAVLRIVHASVYDLILLDLSLRSSPSTDPIEIKREEKLQINGILLAMSLRWLGFQSPIVIVTGGVTRVDKDIFDQAKVNGILIKPVVSANLLSEVARHIGERNHG